MVRGLDRLNPVLVRRYQQVLRSKAFVWTYHLLLAVQLLVALLFVQNAQSRWNILVGTGVGRDHFRWVITQLTVVVVLVLPFMGLQEMSREARQQTLHLLVITRLTPRRIAWGFLAVQAAEVALFVALTTPFLVFSYLFRGVGWLLAVKALSWTTVCALGANAFALMLGSLRLLTVADRIARGFLSVMFVGIVSALSGSLLIPILGVILGAWAMMGMLVLCCMFILEDNLMHYHPIEMPPTGPSWEEP